MLNDLTPSQQMFMLFFSILYGIMLNSLMGLGAFPLAHALASLRKQVKGKRFYVKSRNRFILSFVLLNISPFIYFALVFLFIGLYIDLSLTLSICFILQILFIGLSSLGVFAFFRFFVGCILLKRYGNWFYTPYELTKRILEQIHPNAWIHFAAGILYLAIPWLVFLGVLFLNL